MRRIRRAILVSLVIGLAPASHAWAQPPAIDRVFIIAMENAEYGDVVGSPSAPYLNSLIAQYGLSTNFTAPLHPSLPNYMAVTGGQTVFTTNCDDCRSDGPSIADSIEASGRTWRAYMEGMTGTCGLVNEGLYVVKHNPFVHYRSIADNPARCANIVPFTRFAGDLNAGTLPTYVWITPDLCHDMHDCGVGAGDAWLQSVVPSIIQSPSFANALLLIWWDEGTTAIGGGGHIPLIVVSPRTPAGTRSGIVAGHYDVLRTIEDLWGLAPLGQSANARSLSEFLNLLQKPGFEEYRTPALGSPGWLSDTPVRQSDAISEARLPRSGAQNAACRTDVYLDCGMVQYVTAPKTGTYELTMYANADKPGCLVGADVNSSLGASSWVELRPNYGAPYRFRFNATAGDRITVWMYGSARPGYLVLDDVSLVLVPSPPPPPPTTSPGLSVWTSQDIGAVGLLGASSLSGGVWTVAGAGADIWGFADAFRFVFQPLTGDGQVSARVDSLTFTSPVSKAGVMLRDGIAPNAAHVILNLRPTGDLEFMQRPSSGARTDFLLGSFSPAPSWVRLARAGTTITASISSDGATWIPIAATSANMSNTISGGVAVTSHDNTQLNTAKFQGLSLLAAPWSNQDIGAVGPIGNAAFGGGTFTVNGAGPTGVWGINDTFHFVYRTLTGDGQIVARVTAMQNTNTFAKAGVMMRDGLSASARNVILDIRPTNDVEFMQRTVAGGATTFYAGGTAPPPYWLRLIRSSGVITAAISADGVAWTTIGSTPAPMSTTIQVGLIVSSVDGARLNTSTFDNVTVK